MSRESLPNRSIVTNKVGTGFIDYCAPIGFDDNGLAREIFLSAGRLRSRIDALLNVAGIAISVALQSGVSASAMSVSVGRTGDPAEPVSAIGSALTFLARVEHVAQ